MDKKLPIIIIAVVLVIGVIIGFFVWKNSSSQTPAPKPEYVQQESTIEMVDLKTQPKWVQDLEVTAKKGKSGNGLDNFVLTMTGLDPTVTGVTYSIEYQTEGKGIQGAFSSKPIDPEGEADFSLKSIDLGTCSTKSCVRHTGVTELTVRLDFTTKDGAAAWTGVVPLE